MKFSLTILVCFLLGSCSDQVTVDYSGPTDDWPAYGSSPGGGHYSKATQITPDNVHALEQVWMYLSPDHRQRGSEIVTTPEGDLPSPPSGFQVTPILFNETLYLCTSYNRVVALDPATGASESVTLLYDLADQVAAALGLTGRPPATA